MEGTTVKRFVITLSLLMLALAPAATASIAYGSINNFDTVNDTGVPCHGFEIEIDDAHSTDVTYTYDWNHYGVPKISEDNTDPLHPKVFVRYESGKNPDGSWAAYTAVPSGPISPTDGHQFTNPSVNFGGEHFGVGFYGAPTAVKYNWLIDDGAGNLIHGGVVNISTPTFTYIPPVPAIAAPAQVVAAIVLPPPPAPPVMEFGDASWVKETRTSSHNNNKVELRDLVSDDPADPNDKNWRNGEPDEVEVEWQILQTEYNAANGGANGELQGAPEDLQNGDEVITRRYDFYKYVGPIDAETGEAMCDSVGPDGIHGVGIKTINGVEVDLSTVVVVGDYVGAQMAGFDAAGQIGLIDHLQDGEINVPYVDRTVVIGGTAPIVTTTSGDLPAGMTFDVITGVLSGTPTVSGLFTFTVHSTDANNGDVTKTYSLTISDGGVVAPPHSAITTSASPVAGGSTAGDGDYENGTTATVVATANAGYAFVNWTENGAEVSTSASYEFTVDMNRALVANFVETFVITTAAAPVAGGSTSGDGLFSSGDSVTVVAAANPGYHFVNWTEDGAEVSASASYTFSANSDRTLVANFAVTTYSVITSASPSVGGGTSGDGTFNSGSSVTVVANANAGYTFVNWTEGGAEVSASASYTFTVGGNRNLVANFAPITYSVSVSASPSAGGNATGGGTFNSGSSVTVVANANAGYTFVNWTEGGAEVSASASYTFTLGGNRNLVANFAPITYSVSVSASPSASGSASGGGTFNSGSSVTVVANANAGYAFVNWTEGGVQVSASASYTFTLGGNRNLVANFAPITYSVSVSASPSAGGSASGGGTFNSGSSVTVVANANAGYAFVNWTEGGVQVSASASYTFTLGGNRNLVANFAPVTTTSPTISWLLIDPRVTGGMPTIGLVVLSKPAPAGGAVVQLTSSNSATLQVPASVKVPAGQYFAAIPISTSRVTALTSVTVTAKSGSSQKSSVVNVAPRR